MTKFQYIISLLIVSSLFGQPQNDRHKQLLNMSLQDLMEIKIITAAKNSQNVSDIPASVVVITREEISKLGYRSYTEILDHVTGFYMIDDYHYLGHKNFSVRGFFSPGSFGNVIVLVNGVPQLSDEYMDYPDTKITVPVEAIDRIEIIRGPMSVIYGNGAFFGAINIITNEKNDSKMASAGYGSNNSYSGFVRYASESNGIKYFINSGISQSNGLNIPISKLTSNHKLLDYSNISYNATTKNLLEFGKKYFDTSIEHKSIMINFAYNESYNEIFDAFPSIGEGSGINHQSANINFKYDKAINRNIRFKSLLGYYMHNHTLDYERMINNFFGLDAKRSSAYDIDLTLHYNSRKKFEVLLGAYFRNVIEMYQIADFPLTTLSRGDGEIMIPRDDIISTQSAYSQITYKPLKKLRLIGGIRIEHSSPYKIIYTRGVVTIDTSYKLDPSTRIILKKEVEPSNNGFAITPSFSAIYRINKNNIFKLMYGTAIKQPTFMDNLRQIIMAQPFLKYQKINTFEINYITKINRNFSSNISIFHNVLNDLIKQTNEFSQENGWKFYGSNAGKLATTGLEVFVKWEYEKRIQSKFSLMYQKTKNREKGFEDYAVGYSPELLAYGSIQYSFLPNLHFAVIGKYVDDIETAWHTNMNPEDGYRIGEKIDAYYLLDANLRYSNPYNLPIVLNVNIKNILNHEVCYPTTFSNDWVDKGYLGSGRSLFFSLTYQL